ncbi:cytochrome C [Novosphingobium sp.]|uniref:cytochrome C n=1 Tax=Novosphingobium sp. TaxID=1874826 RepID=UPI0025F883E6|nr:cytochrome C [Novosphingobium sp.]
MKKRMGLFAAATLLGVLSLGTLRAAEPDNHSPEMTAEVRAKMADPELAQSDFIEQCAGCHGVRGTTAPAHLPEIKDRVGWFMCTPESRAYLLRLPNVAHSRITDNAQLADLMNYVVFVLGGKSVPAGTKPFTGEEVAHERQFPLTSVSLQAERLRLAKVAIAKCRAPASLRLQYPGSKQ